MNDPLPTSEPPAPSLLRLAAGIPLVAAILVLVLGGAAGNLRPVEPASVDPDVALPELREPAGELERPPAVFRWTPGGEDVDLTQVLLTDARAERIWGSPPLPGSTSECSVDPSIFDGIPAGEALFWRVREVRAGKPRASSGLQAFRFLVDSRGYGPGEAPPASSVLIE